jgi:hypothetical protein
MSEQDSFDITELSNGKGAAAVLARAAEPPLLTQRMPVKVRRVELDGDYAGWWAEMYMNPPLGIVLQLDGTAQAALEQMPKLIKAWNFGDPDGNPLPITPEGMRELPHDLIEQLATAYSDARGLPKATPAT